MVHGRRPLDVLISENAVNVSNFCFENWLVIICKTEKHCSEAPYKGTLLPAIYILNLKLEGAFQVRTGFLLNRAVSANLSNPSISVSAGFSSLLRWPWFRLHSLGHCHVKAVRVCAINGHTQWPTLVVTWRILASATLPQIESLDNQIIQAIGVKILVTTVCMNANIPQNEGPSFRKIRGWSCKHYCVTLGK